MQRSFTRVRVAEPILTFKKKIIFIKIVYYLTG